MLRCPEGHYAGMASSNHAIAADGAVSPSVWFKGLCGSGPEFHANVRLLGWTPADAARRATSKAAL